ncbi:DUF4270 family protein [Wenyingzhuangia sp. IMCC45467]
MKFTILGIIVTVFMMSCATDDAEYAVGSDFIDSTVEVKVIDTFTVNTGTYKLDSLVTSATNRILIGSVNDAYLGQTTAQSYFQIQNYIFSIDKNAVYDSIGFVLNYDSYYYGDTLQPQTYKIHRITETFEPKDDGDDFYNTSKLTFDHESLGEVTFTPRPNTSTDSIYIPMEYELGEEIFNKIIDDDINTSDDFLQYFKGLTILPDTLSNSHVLGFNAYTTTSTDKNSSMRLYYTLKDEDAEGESYYVEFVVSSTNKQFNAIKTDVTTTNINGVNDLETVIPSQQTNNLIYAQAGTGISARVHIPSIKKLKEMSQVGSSLGAALTFRPLKGTYDKYNPLKDSLSIYVIDHKNRIMNLLTDVDGYTAYAVLNENDDEFDSDTYYSVDLGGFVEEILTTEENLNYSLMIQFVDVNNSVDRVIVEDPESESDRVKLTVKYLNY